VNSSLGILAEIPVTIQYENGTTENYTTNAFGKFTFTPLNKDFTIKVNYLGQTVQKIFDTNPLFSGIGLTLGRIFLDLIIIAALMGLGIVLDEKLI
jgi:hypothetical protein